MPSKSYNVSCVRTVKSDGQTIEDVENREGCKYLSWKTKIFYSFGHIYNDLCASIWFSYTLIYFQLQFEGNIAGMLILLGQVADAMATPFVGFESDRNDTDHWLCRYGRRKTWHLFGTILVTCSFPFIFNECIECGNASETSKTVYYGAFIVMFQIGWAAVQVGHVSLITDLTKDSKERVELNAYRQASTVASSICVYTVTWFILSKKGDSTIKKEDSGIFTLVVYIICAIGIVFSTLFHLFVREPNLPKSASTNQLLCKSLDDMMIYNKCIYRKRLSSFSSVGGGKDEIDKHSEAENGTTKTEDRGKWSDWFKKINFYQVAFIYMMTRLFVNLTQIYTPLYLQKTLELPKKSIAIIPFVTYISGFFWSLITRFISAKSGSKILLAIGCCLGIGSCIWNNFGSSDNEAFRQWQVYGVALLFGVGGTTMLIASLSLTADLIGENTASAAFVFGTMSFFDKILNGTFVLVLEQIHPYQNERSDDDQEIPNETPIKYYQQVVVFVAGSAVVLTFLGLLSIIRSSLGKSDQVDSNEEVDVNDESSQNKLNLKY